MQPAGKDGSARDTQPQTPGATASPIISEGAWGGGLARSRAHVAVVLVHRRGDHEVVWPHDRRRAAYKLPVGAYEVDVGHHTMTLQAALPSKDASFSFDAEISVEWVAVDPSAIVRYKVSDVKEALVPDLLRHLRRIARNFDIAHATDAEDAINDQFGALSIDVTDPSRSQDAVRAAAERDYPGARYGIWTRTIVQLAFDAAAAEHYAKMQQIRWEIEQERASHQLRRVQEQNQQEITVGRMRVYREIIMKGDAELFVLQLASNPQDVGAVLTLFREGKEAKRSNFIEFVSRMIESGVVERWQVSDQARVALEWLREEIAGVIPDRDQRAEVESTYRQHRKGRSNQDDGAPPDPADPPESGMRASPGGTTSETRSDEAFQHAQDSNAQ